MVEIISDIPTAYFSCSRDRHGMGMVGGSTGAILSHTVNCFLLLPSVKNAEISLQFSPATHIGFDQPCSLLPLNTTILIILYVHSL